MNRDLRLWLLIFSAIVAAEVVVRLACHHLRERGPCGQGRHEPGAAIPQHHAHTGYRGW